MRARTLSAPRTGGQPSAPGPVGVRNITPDDWPLIERLFGPHGACGGCWCMHWRMPRGASWDERKGAQNRRDLRKLVRMGRALGCLALVDEEPVGWCSVGPRGDYTRLERSRVLKSPWDEHTWSVVCFFIPARWRGRGVAHALLRGAVSLARGSGARRLEGYPVPLPDTEARYPSTFAYTGVPKLYRRNGFRPLPENERVWVRRFRTTRRAHS